MNLVSLENRRVEVFTLLLKVFKPLIPISHDILHQELHYADYQLSRGIELNGKLIAVYLLFPNPEPFNKLSGRGLEGLALAVDPEFQNQGLGKKLRAYAETLPFDYLWGQADKKLNNLPHWLKVREFLGEKNDSFYTYKMLKGKDEN